MHILKVKFDFISYVSNENLYFVIGNEATYN